MSAAVCVALVTAPDREVGRTLARAVVDEGLAACASVVPAVESVYRWKGAVETASEALLILKTRADRVAALRERVVALHPYEVPEFIVLEVVDGHTPYLDWVRDESFAGEGGR